MSLRDITSPAAVHQALKECDELGREKFLSDHGFGFARKYFLVHEGHHYDSKAIVGVAHGYQFPEQGQLRSRDFSGGERTVRAKLKDLGFEVSCAPETCG
jgi:hypothetical protein